MSLLKISREGTQNAPARALLSILARGRRHVGAFSSLSAAFPSSAAFPFPSTVEGAAPDHYMRLADVCIPVAQALPHATWEAASPLGTSRQDELYQGTRTTGKDTHLGRSIIFSSVAVKGIDIPPSSRSGSLASGWNRGRWVSSSRPFSSQEGAQSSSKNQSEEKPVEEQQSATGEPETKSPGEGETVSELHALKEQLKSVEEMVAEYKDRSLRAYAEIENTRERLTRQADSMKKYAIQDFVKSLLDVADNLGRAAAAVPEEYHTDEATKSAQTDREREIAKRLHSLFTGVHMTEKQLLHVFELFGVKRYDPIDTPFDPTLHDAAFEIPDPTKADGIVAHVTKTGYLLHDRVVRPAQVGVVRNQTD